MTDEIKRMRYFDGLFLTEEEFNLEQDYHNRLRRLHNRHLHSWGIVWGLDVVHGPGSKEVTVKEGMSLNRVLVSGEEVSQEIILTSNTSVDLSGYAANDTVYIYISYLEEEVDIEEEKGGTKNIHWRENAVLSPSETRLPNENENIILARVVIKPDDTIDANSITYEEDGISLRTYAGFSGKLLEAQKLTLGIEGVTSNLASMEGKIIDAENGIQVDSPKTNFKGDIDVAGILTGNLADDIINTDQIVNNAVTAAKIANGSISNAKLANGAVGASKIANGSVDNAKLANSAVTAAKIATGSVGNVKIADGAVNAAKIANGSVDNAKLANGAVNAVKIADRTVGNAKLADNSVNAVKIANGSVGNAKIANGAVSGSKIADNSVSINNLNTQLVWNGTFSILGGNIANYLLDSEERHAFYLVSVYSNTNGGLISWEVRSVRSEREESYESTFLYNRYVTIENLTSMIVSFRLKVYRILES